MIHFFKSFLAVVVFSIVFNSIGSTSVVNAQYYDDYYSTPTGYSYGDYYSTPTGSSYGDYYSDAYYGYGGYSSEPYYGSSYGDYYSEPYYGSSSNDYYSDPYYGSSTYYDYSYSSPSYSSSYYYPTPSYYVAPTSYSSSYYSGYSYPSSYSYSYSSPSYSYPASHYYSDRYYLNNESSNGGLYVTCEPSTRNVPVGSSVTWNAYPNGGTGQYKITWTGDNVRSTGSTQIVTRYTTPGTKTASVTVKTTRDEMSTFCGSVNVYTPDYYDYYSPR